MLFSTKLDIEIYCTGRIFHSPCLSWSVVVINLFKGDVIFRHKFIKIHVIQLSMKAVAERVSNISGELFMVKVFKS